MITLRVSSKRKLISGEGGENNDVKFGYDDDGRLTSVVVDDREQVSITYDSAGNIQDKEPEVVYFLSAKTADSRLLTRLVGLLGGKLLLNFRNSKFV